MIRLKSIFFLMIAVGCTVAKARIGDAQSAKVKTNIELLQILSDSIAQSVIHQGHLGAGDSLDISLPKGEDSWIFSDAFTTALKFQKILLFTGRDSLSAGNISCTVNAVHSMVKYSDMSREGIFGAKKIVRNISLECSLEMLSRRSHEILQNTLLIKTSRDTIDVDDIAHVELDGVRSTHAELPPENFLDKIVEPFIIVGATGVAVYLFFHIRS